MKNLSPIFVVGSYRSGTSIFAWCLGQHSNLVNLPETNWIYQYALNLEKLYSLGVCNGKHSHLGQLGISKEGFYEEMGCCVDEFILKTAGNLSGFSAADEGGAPRGFMRVRNSDDPKQRWVDATPENSHYVYGLSMLFPGAKFIHLVRNPEHVVRSLLKFSNAGGSDYTEIDAYKAWYRLANAAYSAEKAFGSSKVTRILYDDLISKPEETMKTCLAFLDEQYESQCIEPLRKRINSSNVEENNVSTSRIPWPSLRDIKSKSKKLYEALLSDIGQCNGHDEKILMDLQKHHIALSQNDK